MLNEIVTLLVKFVAFLLAGFILALIPKVKEWLDGKISQIDNETLALIVKSFVEAAEQMYKAGDPTGTKRKAYVEDNLTRLGFKITAEINALIEQTVYHVNNKLFGELLEIPAEEGDATCQTTL